MSSISVQPYCWAYFSRDSSLNYLKVRYSLIGTPGSGINFHNFNLKSRAQVSIFPLVKTEENHNLQVIKLFYIYAPIRSMRQQVQHGRYILFPNHIGYNVHEEGAFEWTMDPIPKDHPDITAHIIIPKEIKNQLLSDLAILGITTDFLFCDSLDTVCQGIVDSFKKRY